MNEDIFEIMGGIDPEFDEITEQEILHEISLCE